jgi:hypothetical protein
LIERDKKIIEGNVKYKFLFGIWGVIISLFLILTLIWVQIGLMYNNVIVNNNVMNLYIFFIMFFWCIYLLVCIWYNTKSIFIFSFMPLGILVASISIIDYTLSELIQWFSATLLFPLLIMIFFVFRKTFFSHGVITL